MPVQPRQFYANKQSKPSSYYGSREEFRSGNNISQHRNQVCDPWIRQPSPKRNGGPLEGEVSYPVKRLEKSKSFVSLNPPAKSPKKSCLKQSSSKSKSERMVSFNSIVSYHETWATSEYDRKTVPMSTITWKDMLELRLMRFEATRQAFAAVGLALPPTPPLPSVSVPEPPSLDAIAEEMQTLSIADREEPQSEQPQKQPVQKPIEVSVQPAEQQQQQQPKTVNTQSGKPFTWNVAAAAFTMPQPQVSYPTLSPEINYQNQHYRFESEHTFVDNGPAYSYFIQPPTYGFNYQYGFGTPMFSPYVAV